MSRVLAPLLLILLASAAPARAEDDADKDAPLGTRSPATVAWRAAPLGGLPPIAHAAASADLLKSTRDLLAAEPESKSKADLLGALDELAAGAESVKPEERQAWIDGHLGTFNETLRTLDAGAPQSLVLKAAKAAARLNGAAQRWEESRAFSEKALAYDPEDRDALISRSQANNALSDFARGYADAERAARMAPDSSDALAARAAAAYGLGNYLQAAEDARRALALDADNRSAFQIMKLSEGRAKKAPDFEGSGQAQLADTVEREYHGMIERQNQIEERRQAPIEQPGPSAVARLLSSSGSKLKVKDYQGAIDDADRTLALDPANLQAFYYRAEAHNLEGEYGEAVRDATRGLAVSPADWWLHDTRAYAYNRMGRFVDAVADAHFALETNPRDGYALANRAYADEQRGDYQSMAEDYKAASELNPQFEPTYADAARRHGLSPTPTRRDKRIPELTERQRSRARSFATVIFSSLLGGLLIALGVLHVSSMVKESAPPAPPPPAGGIEAAYALGKPLGQGGMGVVYEAFDRKLKRNVAIKMLRDEFKLDDAAKASFLEEARTVAELHHPAIVGIHNIIEDDRGLYLVFERLEGRTLDQVIAEKKRIPFREIKATLKVVCEALEYAHAHDVVHRDLKPANVMLTADGVKVLDFGISRHAASAGKAATTQTVVGTPHYMAPEQEYGIVRKENDVFSLGAVLYEMTTGVRPYEGAHQAKLAKAYLRVSTRLRGAPLELDALVDRCLEPDPEKRLRSPAEFWRLLSAVPDFLPSDDA